MSGSGDNVLLELFREEVRTNVQTLNDGLVALEGTPTDVRQIEPLMRAAHSVKGAARVVDVDAAVTLAHAAEDCLVAAQEGRITLDANDIDTLLKAADLLVGIGESAGPNLPQWLAQSGGEIDALAQVLSARALGAESKPPVCKSQDDVEEPSQPGVAKEPPTSVDTAFQADSAAARQPSPPTDPVREETKTDAAVLRQPLPGTRQDSANAVPTPVPTPVTPVKPQELKATPAEQVVRVTAQSLTRLMGLAGESLVESRWLQPFSKSLLALKRQQSLLADSLEELRQSLPPDDVDARRSTLLAEASKRLAKCRRMLAAQIGEFENRARSADDLNSRLYDEVIASRMRPFGDGVQGFPRMVRDLARQLGKKVVFEIRGERMDVDRDILEKLEAPLNHILRNGLDHGLETPAQRLAAGKAETCSLAVEARHNAGMLVITVTDDGRGIDLEGIRRKVIQRKLADERIARELSAAELLEFLFLPAFSTADGVTEVSGRGVGLDVVHSMVQSVGGTVQIHSELGKGTVFQLELPITLSVIRAVLVRIAGAAYAFPHNRIDRLVRLTRSDLQSLEERQHFEVDGRNVGIVLASQILEMEAAPADKDELFAILFSHHSDQYGLLVDEFRGERDLVVRPLDTRLGKVPNINAVAILDDGSPVLIVDLDDMRRSIERQLHSATLGRAGDRHAQDAEAPAMRILVVDDSITVREVQRQLLVNHGYEVEVAVDGMEAWNILSRGQFDLVVTDVDMPRLNGIDLVRMIKNDAQLHTTPVVIVSYKDREEDHLRGMQAGADYYLTKSSFHDETLLEAVRDLIGEAH